MWRVRAGWLALFGVRVRSVVASLHEAALRDVPVARYSINVYRKLSESCHNCASQQRKSMECNNNECTSQKTPMILPSQAQILFPSSCHKTALRGDQRRSWCSRRPCFFVYTCTAGPRQRARLDGPKLEAWKANSGVGFLGAANPIPTTMEFGEL